MVRSDALANRDRILAVARSAIEQDGEVSLNRIAQLAGVGAGTLYRHFPQREALVLAVYRAEVEALVASADDLLGAHAPLDALRDWTLALVGLMRLKHGLGDALSPTAQTALTEQTYEPVVGAITRMLDAGRADGSVRQDASASDFLLLTAALWRAPAEGGHTERMLDLVLDGLRARR